jgi:uncharacterized repeat protein (TIGR01451 family)
MTDGSGLANSLSYVRIRRQLNLQASFDNFSTIGESNLEIIHKYLITNALQSRLTAIKGAGNMYRRRFHASLGLLIAIFLGTVGDGQADHQSITVKAIAEVELRVVENGREISKLAPADRVVSGDWVIYTLEVRNAATTTVRAPTVTYPVPEHMSYVAESAVGPATEVSFSVDGGRSFDVAENLKIQDADGQRRPAASADYTHIRWQLKNSLKANSVAFVRFRARVK